MKRQITDRDKGQLVELRRLAKEAMAINSKIEGVLSNMELAEAKELKRIASARNPSLQVEQLDASILKELQMLVEKYFNPRTPQNLESILLELLRLLSKIIWKLFIIQGMQPPGIDPRLFGEVPARHPRNG